MSMDRGPTVKTIEFLEHPAFDPESGRKLIEVNGNLRCHCSFMESTQKEQKKERKIITLVNYKQIGDEKEK